MESSGCRSDASSEQSAWSYSLTAECEPVRVKDEPAWGECGVSEAAAAEHLYAEHEVKDELVIGPEQIQQQDIAFAMQNAQSSMEEASCKPKAESGADAIPECSHTCPGDGLRCNGSTEQQHGLRSCYVRLQRLPEGDPHSHYWELNGAKDTYKLEPADGAAPECPHTRPGEGPQCNMSHEQQSKLRNCFVRLERILVEDLPTCNICLRTKNTKTSRLSKNSNNISKSQGRKQTVLASHKDEKRCLFECDICSNTFPRKQDLMKHVTINHSHKVQKPKLFKCDKCNKCFTTRNSFIARNRSHTREKTNSSVKSSKTLRYPSGLAEHKEIHGRKIPYSCNICNKQFALMLNLNHHMRLHTDKKPYICDVCNKNFSCKRYLNAHAKTHTGIKPFSCDVCKSQFSQKSYLSKHSRTHTGDKPFSCDVCKSQFSRMSYLTEHKRTHTGEKPFSCDVCKLQFCQSSHLARHRLTHTGEKHFSCDVCASQFSRKSHLTEHRRTHSGEKPFFCTFCSSRFTTRGALVTHIRIHTGEKPFCCDICSSRFTTRGSLVVHIRTHTGEKPFPCDVCNWQFSDKSKLTRHRRTHTGEKPYSCRVCSEQFARKSRLTCHMVTHSGVNLD